MTNFFNFFFYWSLFLSDYWLGFLTAILLEHLDPISYLIWNNRFLLLWRLLDLLFPRWWLLRFIFSKFCVFHAWRWYYFFLFQGLRTFIFIFAFFEHFDSISNLSSYNWFFLFCCWRWSKIFNLLVLFGWCHVCL